MSLNKVIKKQPPQQDALNCQVWLFVFIFHTSHPHLLCFLFLCHDHQREWFLTPLFNNVSQKEQEQHLIHGRAIHICYLLHTWGTSVLFHMWHCLKCSGWCCKTCSVPAWETLVRAREISQRVKAFVTESDNLNSIPGTHTTLKEKWLPHVFLWSPLLHIFPKEDFLCRAIGKSRSLIPDDFLDLLRGEKWRIKVKKI